MGTVWVCRAPVRPRHAYHHSPVIQGGHDKNELIFVARDYACRYDSFMEEHLTSAAIETPGMMGWRALKGVCLIWLSGLCYPAMSFPWQEGKLAGRPSGPPYPGRSHFSHQGFHFPEAHFFGLALPPLSLHDT